MRYIVRFHGSGAEANRRLRAAGFDRFNASADYITAAASAPEFNHHRTVVEAKGELEARETVQVVLGSGFAVFSASAAHPSGAVRFAHPSHSPGSAEVFAGTQTTYPG